MSLVYVQGIASHRRIIFYAALLPAIGAVATSDNAFGSLQAGSYDGAHTTIVTDPVGAQWEYVYQHDLGVPRLVSRIRKFL